MIAKGNRFAQATVFAFAFVTGPTSADASYYDYLNCAAHHWARNDYVIQIEHVVPDSVSARQRDTGWYLRAAEQLVPKSQMPCGHGLAGRGDPTACVILQIMAPQLNLLRLEHITQLVEQTGGSGPLPECSADAVCAKCEELPAPKELQ